MTAFIAAASLLLPVFIRTQQTEVRAETEESEEQEEDAITLDLASEEDVADAQKRYGKQFEGADVKLITTGYPDFYIPFLKQYAFQSLDLAMADANPNMCAELSDGTVSYLSEVQGLEKLTVEDYYGLHMESAGVFSDLKELTLIEDLQVPSVFGRIGSGSLPALETMNVYFKDKDTFDNQTKRVRGLFFPETLKTLELYTGGSVVSADSGVWARLFAPLLISCPNVSVNGKTLQEIKAYNDEYGYAFFEDDVRENILESLLYKTYADVVQGRAQITEAAPVIGGKLVFMSVRDDEITSISVYDKNISVPEEYLASDLDDTDMAVIFYDEYIPSTDESPYSQTATKAILTDVKAGIVYPVQTVLTDSVFNPQAAADTLLQSYNPAFRSSGTLTCRSLFDAAGIRRTRGVVSDEMVQQILGLLNNDVYRITMDLLKGGEVVVAGSTGAPTAGVQQTLWDIGCPVGADGYAGPETFQQLNALLAFFGKPETDRVDAERYAQLLAFKLLSTVDANTSREILAGYFKPGENSSEFEYMRACALFKAGFFDSARRAFLMSNYKDSESRAMACAQPLPGSGEYFHNGNFYSDAMRLVFTVNSYNPSEGNLFEVYTTDGTHVSSMFVLGSGSVSASLPGGQYRIRYISGTEWYGWAELFGAEQPWQYMTFYEFESDKYATDLPAGYEWQISINVESSPGGSGVGSTTVPW